VAAGRSEIVQAGHVFDAPAPCAASGWWDMDKSREVRTDVIRSQLGRAPAQIVAQIAAGIT
jgi:hypothetical protein